MGLLGYYAARVKAHIFKDSVCNYYRHTGMRIGKKCKICGYLKISEPFLVELGDEVVISGGVSFVTHDHSISKVSDKSNLFGKIKIGNNCFVGHRSIILYGVELADNVIVAAGSVVTKSFLEERIIIGGNPARKIGDWDSFANKYANMTCNCSEIDKILLDESDKLVSR